MNNLRDIRLKKGYIRIQDFAAALDFPGVDIPMISKIETDVVRPNPALEDRMCQVLGCEPEELFGEWRQTILPNMKPETLPERDERVEKLISHLGAGAENAVSRSDLCRFMDTNDRQLRKLIARAEEYGYSIGNISNGRGYFLTLPDKEGYQYWKQERSRAMAILHRQRNLRRKLKEAGYDVS